MEDIGEFMMMFTVVIIILVFGFVVYERNSWTCQDYLDHNITLRNIPAKCIIK